MKETEQVTTYLPKIKEFEYTGEYRIPHMGEYYLSRNMTDVFVAKDDVSHQWIMKKRPEYLTAYEPEIFKHGELVWIVYLEDFELKARQEKLTFSASQKKACLNGFAFSDCSKASELGYALKHTISKFRGDLCQK